VHERRDLASMARRHCGWTIGTEEELTGKGAGRIPFSSVDIPRAAAYAAEAADCTLSLHQVLLGKIAADEKLKFVYEKIEVPVLPVLTRMERNGVLLDAAKLEAQSHGSARRSSRRSARRSRPRAAVQPRLAQADPRDPVRAAEAPG
jgi:DNA polymerase-1